MDERWLTFDCYGTLVDWDAGMKAALTPSVGTNATPLLDAFRAVELVAAATRPWMSYEEILRRGLRRAARRTGIALPAGGENAFVAGWCELPVYDDVGPALKRLAEAGWKLGVLTNCDEDLFHGTRQTLPVALDVVVTAEAARSYKPDLEHFRLFAQTTGAGPSNWIHVGSSWVHDMLPAARCDLTSIWVDRHRTGHPAAAATRRIDDMAALPPTVEELRTNLPSRSDLSSSLWL